MKKIILCADDYGQNEAISQAIIALIQKKRLSATSCMTTSPEWVARAAELLPYQDQVDLGLHFNLTEGQPLSTALKHLHGFLSLPKLIARAYARALDKAALEQELHEQLDRFVEAIGRLPDFIDGHQHVHQFPVIRDVLFKVLALRFKDQPCYLRCVFSPNIFLSPKMLILQVLGAGAFKRAVLRRKIAHNTSFAGVYSFGDSARYAELFPHFLKQIKSGGIIMCHPGLNSFDQTDQIAAARHHEYQYLASDQFVQNCFGQGVVLSRFTF